LLTYTSLQECRALYSHGVNEVRVDTHWPYVLNDRHTHILSDVFRKVQLHTMSKHQFSLTLKKGFDILR